MSDSHRIPRKGGEEQDMLSRYSRRIVRHKRGRTKAAKASYNRRQRRALKPTKES